MTKLLSKRLGLPESTQYLKDTTIYLPKELSDRLPGHKTIRLAYNTMSREIYVVLVPTKGSGIHRLAARLDVSHVPYSEYDRKARDEAIDLARDNVRLAMLIGDYIRAGKVELKIKQHRQVIDDLIEPNLWEQPYDYYEQRNMI